MLIIIFLAFPHLKSHCFHYLNSEEKGKKLEQINHSRGATRSIDHRALLGDFLPMLFLSRALWISREKGALEHAMVLTYSW